MPYTTLINATELRSRLEEPDWRVIDCRFDLAETEAGRRAYQAGHIPGALYAHLDEDLSGPIIPGQTGRHPLPPVETLARTFSSWGIDDRVQVVAYDALNGAVAARLWWLLRWLGHEAVAVLNGGWQGWQAEGHPVSAEKPVQPARTFTPRPRLELLANVTDILATRDNPAYRLFDARSADRYRGENETLDPVAGHIPGAISAPFAENLDAQGHFLPKAALQARFQDLLGTVPPERAIFYCGSGVTAAHNLLALAHADLGEGRLYAGSWSEWITDPTRPIAPS